MSGIVGIARRGAAVISVESLGRMAAAVRHRGPDGYGFYVGQRVGLGHVRLSIVDIAAGSQPLANEDGQIVITCDGEIYNHPELRREPLQDSQRRVAQRATRGGVDVNDDGFDLHGASQRDQCSARVLIAASCVHAPRFLDKVRGGAYVSAMGPQLAFFSF